jgi:hypothetical protein
VYRGAIRLGDANDQVKIEATRVLPKLAGAMPALIDGLCRRLLVEDSAWVQVQAALARLVERLGSQAGAEPRPVAGG